MLSKEVLASKKLRPGHQFKAPNKLWASRSKVSEASWLALKRLLRDLGKLQKGKARKITRAAFEERLERASLVCLPVVKWRTINEINSSITKLMNTYMHAYIHSYITQSIN